MKKKLMSAVFAAALAVGICPGLAFAAGGGSLISGQIDQIQSTAKSLSVGVQSFDASEVEWVDDVSGLRDSFYGNPESDEEYASVKGYKLPDADDGPGIMVSFSYDTYLESGATLTIYDESGKEIKTFDSEWDFDEDEVPIVGSSAVVIALRCPASKDANYSVHQVELLSQDLAKAEVEGIEDFYYAEDYSSIADIKPVPSSVTWYGEELVRAENAEDEGDYYLEYGFDGEDYYVELQPTGNSDYDGYQRCFYSIMSESDLSGAVVTVDGDEVGCEGDVDARYVSSVEPYLVDLVVRNGRTDDELIAGRDYSVEYRYWNYGTESSVVDGLSVAGWYDICIAGSGDKYHGEKWIYLHVVDPVNIGSGVIEGFSDRVAAGDSEAFCFVEEGISLHFFDEYGEEYELREEDGDMAVEYLKLGDDGEYHVLEPRLDGSADGAYRVKITPVNNWYVGVLERDFTIVADAVPLSDCYIDRNWDSLLDEDGHIFVSSHLEPSVSVYYFDGNGRRVDLVAGQDYTTELRWSNEWISEDLFADQRFYQITSTTLKPGVYAVAVVGSGNYAGTCYSSFVMYKKTPKPAIAKTVGYTGGIMKPVKDGEGYEYFGDSRAIAVGNYWGSVTLNYFYAWSDGSDDDIDFTWSIVKAANPLQVKAKAVKAKKNKKTTIKVGKAFTVSGAQGAVTYKKKSGNKKIAVAKNGKVTVKKGLKKGTYKVKVDVTAAGNGNYNASTKTVTMKVKVK